jgi:hypothetical protein
MRKLIRALLATSCGLFACLALAGAARADTYPVNDPSDLPDAAVGNGVCATAAGTCTLRAAIQEPRPCRPGHAQPLDISSPDRPLRPTPPPAISIRDVTIAAGAV